MFQNVSTLEGRKVPGKKKGSEEGDGGEPLIKKKEMISRYTGAGGRHFGGAVTKHERLGGGGRRLSSIMRGGGKGLIVRNTKKGTLLWYRQMMPAL